MWAASTIPQPRPWPPNTLFRTTSERPHALPVSAKFGRPRNLNHNDYDSCTQVVVGVLGKGKAVAVVTALKSTSPHTPTSIGTHTKQERQSAVQQKQPSGSDILWALQRATAQKKKKRESSSRDTSSSSTSATVSKSSRVTEEETRSRSIGLDNNNNNSKVKPLCIESEWSVRLDELETRLQDLLLDTT